ncbi:MAG: AMP-binding protein, partial [Candidatus Acidiferrales bacterium]
TRGAMPRQSLLEYFQPNSRSAEEIAVTSREGYRTRRWSYAELLRSAATMERRLGSHGIAKGDRVLLWGENSGEWVAAFLGCLFRGAVTVPMDAIADPGFARRVALQSGAKLAIASRALLGSAAEMAIPAECLDDLRSARAEDGALPAAAGAARAARSDPVEIVFTSGTTAEPRGVVLTHGNLLANLEPIEREIMRYRRYERIFHPLRFLDLLPLSHVFGQLLGIFLPQILGGTAIFLDTLNPNEVIQAIRSERVSVLVTVPRLIESLQNQIERDLEGRGRLEKFERSFRAAERQHFLKRWWRFRAIRRRFGWKFWAMICGGAALPASAETFWTRLGYAVIQGYGLTETTSLVSLNHPFRLSQGSIGKAVAGLEVKLAPDGEILVRGENVAAGYWKDAGVESVLDADGWFHTGDLGARDEQGDLFFKGRRKNVIVTPAGLNIYPGDLEAELRREPEVRDCVAIGLERDGNAEPCAVLLLRGGATTEAMAGAASNAANRPATAAPSQASRGAAEIVESANSRLAPFQQMRRWIVWPEQDFPRTPTQKANLARIQEFAQRHFEGHAGTAAAGGAGVLETLLNRIGHGAGRKSAAGEAIDPRSLTSIERVELLSALEDRYQVDLSETEFANVQTAAALEKLIENPPAHGAAFHFPRWAQSRPIRWIRVGVLYTIARLAMLLLGWPRVTGQENLERVKGPVLVVANHITYVDPAYVLAALPGRWRRRLAVAMQGEVLEAMRRPPAGMGIFRGLLERAGYWLVVALFNVFPLPKLAGFRKSFAFAGELVDGGASVLVFPEGHRTADGRMAPFRAGIGLLATRLGVPVVPMRIDGLFEMKRANKRWARPGAIRVSIGRPVQFRETDSAEEIVRDLERRVAELGADGKTKNGKK